MRIKYKFKKKVKYHTTTAQDTYARVRAYRNVVGTVFGFDGHINIHIIIYYILKHFVAFNGYLSCYLNTCDSGFTF